MKRVRDGSGGNAPGHHGPELLVECGRVMLALPRPSGRIDRSDFGGIFRVSREAGVELLDVLLDASHAVLFASCPHTSL
jgi:hypothetical protein